MSSEESSRRRCQQPASLLPVVKERKLHLSRLFVTKKGLTGTQVFIRARGAIREGLLQATNSSNICRLRRNQRQGLEHKDEIGQGHVLTRRELLRANSFVNRKEGKGRVSNGTTKRIGLTEL